MQRFDLNQIAPSPWKNGGGSTREIACWPQGAGMDSFGWRVSVAVMVDEPETGLGLTVAAVDADAVPDAATDGVVRWRDPAVEQRAFLRRRRRRRTTADAAAAADANTALARHGQLHHKRAAVALAFALDPDLPAVQLHDPARDEQPKAAAAARLEFLRRELHDLVEYPLLVFQPEPYRIPDTAE
jgi:hypothetical protein